MKTLVTKVITCSFMLILLCSFKQVKALTTIESGKYTVTEDNYVCDIVPNTTAEVFAKNVQLDETDGIYKDGKKQPNNTVVGTGMVLKLGDGTEYILSVRGDISGDGKATGTDLVQQQKVIVGLNKIAEYEKYAIDINNDGKFTGTDVLQFKRFLVKLIDSIIKERYIDLVENFVIDLSDTKQDLQLVAKVIPGTAPDTELTWSSSDKNIVEVNENGRLVAKKHGKAYITAKTKNNRIAYCEVEVQTTPTSISLNTTKEVIDLSNPREIELVATIQPENANAKTNVTYTSSNPNIATVNAKGKVTAKGNGSAQIRAVTENGKEEICSIEVQTTPLSIALNTASETLNLEDKNTFQLTATIQPTTANAKTKVTYTSDNKSVATVDENGKVMAIAEGTATITATTENGKTAKTVINVEEVMKDFTVSLADGYADYNYISEDTIYLFYQNSSSKKLDNGKTKKPSSLQLVLTADNGSVPKNVTYTSSNTGIFTVSETGLLVSTAKPSSAYTTTVRATGANLTISSGGITKTFKVSVSCSSSVVNVSCDNGGWTLGTTNKGTGHYQRCTTCYQCHRFHEKKSGDDVSDTRTDDKIIYCSLCGGWIRIYYG